MFIRIFAAYNGTEPMPKETSIKHNSLNINALPPPIGGGKDFEGSPFNSYIIKLVSRILDMADGDYSVLTPINRETLRDVLACGSIEKVAKKQHQSDSNIRIKANKAIDALNKQMEIWQAPHQKLLEQGRRIHELEIALENDKRNRELVKKLTNMLDVQAHKYSMLEAENRALKQEIVNLKAERPLMDPQSINSYVKAEEKTKLMLKRTLKEIKISIKLVDKLKFLQIETVYDLVRYSEEQLSRLRIISNTDLRRINQALKKTGLTLGTDVRWVEASQEYYIKR